ncbi:hypothetical protein RS694_08180 [Rhodoferax saidenbachensis]|uniref:Uncharacterized protein n=2 Tax=Rhodoferax saidenbachensis TaxID=1484693 RepID=A0A1P8K966_9BURK|nr:hypothetical protein RS694_08180 [Rhodoferax saidenbachensis]
MLGQPLEVSVPVQVDAEEGGVAQCFEADVFYGDTRLEASRVVISADAATQGNTVLVRVSASPRVDEPVVTVYLRAGCAQKTSRRYVLLADLASEVSPPVATPAPAARAVPAPEPVRAAPVAPQEPARSTVAAPQKAQKAQPARVEKTEPVASAPRKPEQAAPSRKQARLKLAPLDLPERDPTLKLSSELLSAPLEDLQKRAEAIATWRALNATPEDMLREDARMHAMEGDLKNLQALTAKNKQSLSDITTRLEQAEAQRYANPMIYGLIALLVLFGAALVFAWTRLRDASRSSAPWWRDSVKPETARTTSGVAAEQDEDHFSGTRGDTDSPITLAPAPFAAAPVGMASVDIDLELGEPDFASAIKAPPVAQMAARPTAQDHHGFSSSALGSLRAINTKEMLDVRQQAEFFMTLGQYEEAITLLKHSISDSGEANPLVYLDLLKVFHTLSRKDDYDHYRDDFNRLFTGHVPVYTAFNRGGNSLDAYPEVCQRIAELWPSQDAVDYIERCLARTPGASENQEFDLEAYRELLMLHGVAQRMDGASDSALAPFSAVRSVPYLSGGGSYGAEPTIAVPVVQVESASVDLDLSEPEHNLIDFEVSGFSQTGPLTPPKPKA